MGRSSTSEYAQIQVEGRGELDNLEQLSSACSTIDSELVYVDLDAYTDLQEEDDIVKKWMEVYPDSTLFQFYY
jgi:hypothetical protein